MGNLFDGIFPGKQGVTEMLLTLMGTSGEIISHSQEIYDPLSGTITPQPALSANILCSAPLKVTEKDADGVNIFRSDSYVISNYDSLSGDIYDYSQGQLKVHNAEYNIIAITPYYTEHDTAGYKLFLREDNNEL
jgi:hypothetical protein